MADYNKPIRKNKRKKDPPWAEAFDQGEITPEQERKTLADIEFNRQMALSDKYAKRAKGWGALAKGMETADTASGVLFPAKGAVKLVAKLGKKLLRKKGKKLKPGDTPDAPFRKSTDKEAEWFRGPEAGSKLKRQQFEANKAPRWERTPSGRIKATALGESRGLPRTTEASPLGKAMAGLLKESKGANRLRRLEALADDYVKAKKSGRITLKSAPKPRPVFRAPAMDWEKWIGPDLKKHVRVANKEDIQKHVRRTKPSIYPKAAGPVALGTGAGFIAGSKYTSDKKDKEASERLKKSIIKKATKKKPKTYWPEDLPDLDAEEARALGRRAKKKLTPKKNDDID